MKENYGIVVIGQSSDR